jgi:hypothetical protein
MNDFVRLSIEAVVEPGQFVMADYHDKFRIVPRQKNLSIKNRTFARRDVGIEFALFSAHAVLCRRRICKKQEPGEACYTGT